MTTTWTHDPATQILSDDETEPLAPLPPVRERTDRNRIYKANGVWWVGFAGRQRAGVWANNYKQAVYLYTQAGA